MISLGAQALNEMVLSWQSDNIFIWTLVEIEITLAPATATYITPTATPIIGIESAFLRLSDSDIPLAILSMRQYEEVYNKGATGQPDSILYTPTEPPTITCWPVPDTAGTIACLAITRQQDFDSSSDTGGFPSRWNEALSYNLAARLCDEFPIPLNERVYLVAKAEKFLARARLGNREKPTEDFVKGAF